MPKPIKREILKALEAYQQRVADILTKQGVKAHIVGDLKAYKELAPIAIDFGSVQKGAKEFGVKYGALLRNEGATMIKGKKVFWLADSIKKTRGDVANIINEGVRTGKGTDAIARELRGTLIRDKNYEYKRIARTETGNIQAAAADKRYKEEGVEEVDWLCGQKPCPICAQHCGKRYKINEAPALLLHPNGTCDKAPVVTRRVRTKIDKKSVETKKKQEVSLTTWAPATKKFKAPKKKPVVTKKTSKPELIKEKERIFDTDTEGIRNRLEPYSINRFGTPQSKLQLTVDEANAAKGYQSIGYATINDGLRGKIKLTEWYKKEVKFIDSALLKSKVPEDVQVFRGISANQAEILKKANISINKGYTSTAYDPGSAYRFTIRGEDGYCNIMQMKAKKGTNALLWSGGENEVMLERGLKLKCTGIREMEDVVMKQGGIPTDAARKIRIFVMEEVPTKKKVVVPLTPKPKTKEETYAQLKKDERATADKLWEKTKKDGNEHVKVTNSKTFFADGDKHSVRFKTPKTPFDTRHTHPNWDSPLSGVDLGNFLSTTQMKTQGASSYKTVYLGIRKLGTTRFMLKDKKMLAEEFEGITSEMNKKAVYKFYMKTGKDPTEAQGLKIWHGVNVEANKIFAKKYKYEYISFGRKE